MDDNYRSFAEIFSSLQRLARLRNVSSETEDKDQQTPAVCLCGRAGKFPIAPHEMGNQTGENPFLPSSTTGFRHFDEDRRDAIYISRSMARHGETVVRFAVCPACDPRPDCSFCDGTGLGTVKTAHFFETEDGEEIRHIVEDVRSTRCSCMTTSIIVSLLNDAGLPAKYMEAELSSFRSRHLDENARRKLTQNINRAIRFSKSFPGKLENKAEKREGKYFLTLFGPVGSGKTHLACVTLKMLIMNCGFSGKFVDFQFLLSRLRACYDQKQSGESIMEELRRVDVLLIDEFGKGRSENEWQLSMLDDLINSRYNSGKITLLTTNYLPPDRQYAPNEAPRSRAGDGGNPPYLDYTTTFNHRTPVNESFWEQSLAARIGSRMYERILEVSEFIDFTGIPSYRKYLGRALLEG